MNRIVILGLACALGALILTVQLVRRRRGALLDPVELAGWLYFVCFVAIPVCLQLLDLSVYWETAWRWIFRHPFTDDAFVYASLIAFMGYPLILAGARCGEALLVTVTRVRRLPPGVVHDRSPETDLVFAGSVALLLGTVSLVLYAQSIGGIVPLLLEGILFRGDNPPVVSNLAFLKNVATVVLGASYCFYALRASVQRGITRQIVGALLLVSFCLSFIVLYHGAGRLVLIAYLVAFPLARMSQGGRWQWRMMLVLTTLALGVVLFGKQLFLLRSGPEGLLARWATVRGDASRAFTDVMMEFSFPYLTLANTSVDVPNVSPYRFFADVPLAGLYLVPQRVFGLTHPQSVSMVNTELVTDGGSGTIPVDLLSFGYFSVGLIGVVAVSLAFGAALTLCEPVFSGRKGAVFRMALLFFMAFRVMYGDPVLAAQAGFNLILIVALLLLPRALRHALSRPGTRRMAIA